MSVFSKDDRARLSYSKSDPVSSKKNDIKIAKELGYSANVIAMLNGCDDPNKRVNILHDARVGKIQ